MAGVLFERLEGIELKEQIGASLRLLPEGYAAALAGSGCERKILERMQRALWHG